MCWYARFWLLGCWYCGGYNVNPIAMIVILLVIVLVLGGGFYGYRGSLPINAGYGFYGLGSVGGIVLLILILWLLGVFR
jgi:hypothetical protein